MRRLAVLMISIVLLIAIHLGVSGQELKTKPTPKVVSPAPKVPSAPPEQSNLRPEADKNEVAKKLDDVEPIPPATQPPSADEIAVVQTGESYVKSFNQGDFQAAADHYTEDAEYIDEHGHLIQSRKAIAQSLKEFFAAFPGCQLQLTINSIRFVGPGVAIEDGTTTVIRSRQTDPVINHYTAVHLMVADEWLVASVRDFVPNQRRQNKTQLRQFDWMLGEWVHEGGDAVVAFACQPVDDGNFLVRTFTIQIAGQHRMSGSQRIGWDAQTGKFRAWIFDSEGGHSEGYWHRDGDSWVLKTTGATGEGQTASSTSIYTFLNDHTMTFQSVDHEVSGWELPDSPKVTIVRRAPQPE